MPKFVDSSGQVCSSNIHDKKKDDEDIKSLLPDESGHLNASRKPSAINKKNTKEKQKNSLDLFKEELRKLNEERENQRRKLKDNFNDSSSRLTEDQISHFTTSQLTKLPPQPVPLPLIPDPRCSTSLTLQVNLNPKDAASFGSYDTGDPTTTNLYLGNINPTVNENDLCDLFGKFGPLASIKIMWPRTDEEKARNRNSGFVAYMSRIDAERVLKALNGREFKGYDMKLGEYVLDLTSLKTNDINDGFYVQCGSSRQADERNHYFLPQKIAILGR